MSKGYSEDRPGVEIDDGILMLLTRLNLIFGGMIPFIPQYYEIHKTQDASGFSTFVCFIIVLSNVLRIAYWFGHYFDLALLGQSVVMSLAMLVMLELCLRVERKRTESRGVAIREVAFTDFDWQMWWQWTSIWSYIQVTILMLLASVLYTTLFVDFFVLIEPIGYAALLVESTYPMPQIVKNYRNNSTVGMSVGMVILWLVGDLVKGYFFVSTGQPLPFIICATIHLCCDGVLIYQIFAYK